MKTIRERNIRSQCPRLFAVRQNKNHGGVHNGRQWNACFGAVHQRKTLVKWSSTKSRDLKLVALGNEGIVRNEHLDKDMHYDIGPSMWTPIRKMAYLPKLKVAANFPASSSRRCPPHLHIPNMKSGLADGKAQSDRRETWT